MLFQVHQGNEGNEGAEQAMTTGRQILVLWQPILHISNNQSIRGSAMKTYVKMLLKDFPGGTVDKNLPASAGECVQSQVWEDSICHGTTKPVHHNY